MKQVSIRIALGALVFVFIIISVFLILDTLSGFNYSSDFTEKVKTSLNLNKAKEPKVDNRPIEIEVLNKQVNLVESFTTVAIKANKQLTMQQNNRLMLKEVDEVAGEYTYVVEITSIPIDDSSISLNFIDEVQNTKELKINLTRESGFSLFGKDYVEAWEDTKYILDGNDFLANVNKQNRLLNTYEPTDLVNLYEDYKDIYVNSTDFQLRAEAASALNVMISQLVKDTGKNVLIVSAYRSYNTQARLYAGYLRKDSQESVDTYSARPGFSEHQLGTAVDITNDEAGYQLEASLDKTSRGKWLTENSYKYGFIKSYPEKSDPKKSYGYEAWHYRYVGIEAAKEIHDSGMIPTDWMEAQKTENIKSENLN